MGVNSAINRLFGQVMTGELWAHLGVTSLLWIVLPMAIGLGFLLRSEVSSPEVSSPEAK
ncbi:hypothetical protein BH23ACT6_BH23ACT6_13410 [soil metagenome]